MDSKIISNWLRQARYRAKKYNIYCDLSSQDVQYIIQAFNDCCAYCGNPAQTLDSLFSLKSATPNVPANVVTACRRCKSIKKSNDVVWMFANNHLNRDKYLKIMEIAFALRGGEIIKDRVRQVTGLEG